MSIYQLKSPEDQKRLEELSKLSPEQSLEWSIKTQNELLEKMPSGPERQKAVKALAKSEKTLLSMRAKDAKEAARKAKAEAKKGR